MMKNKRKRQPSASTIVVIDRNHRTVDMIRDVPSEVASSRARIEILLDNAGYDRTLAHHIVIPQGQGVNRYRCIKKGTDIQRETIKSR